jgi:hypothetical protein
MDMGALLPISNEPQKNLLSMNPPAIRNIIKSFISDSRLTIINHCLICNLVCMYVA